MKDEEFWNEDAIIKDLLFETNMSVPDIAKELGWTTGKTSQRIKQLGLSWVRRNNRKLSRGHAALTKIIQNLLPGEEVINEYHIGERLMLDIYCPTYKIAAEYHGRQHFFYSNHFYKDQLDFKRAQERDVRKEELCKELGIVLVVFRFNDSLSDKIVFERILEAIQMSPEAPAEEKKTLKGNPYYEKMKQRQREYRKNAYRQAKLKRKNGNN